MQKKRRVDLKGLRKAILARAKGEVLDIFNAERFARNFDAEHAAALLAKSSNFKVLYISREEEVDERIQDLLSRFAKAEVRWLPIGGNDFQTEILIFAESVAVSDGTLNSMIDNVSFAKDMRRLFFQLWDKARPCAD